MIRIQLDGATREELHQMRRGDLPDNGRDHLEMVLLADAGRSTAQIAEHPGYGYRTALNVLNDFRDRGGGLGAMTSPNVRFVVRRVREPLLIIAKHSGCVLRSAKPEELRATTPTRATTAGKSD